MFARLRSPNRLDPYADPDDYDEDEEEEENQDEEEEEEENEDEDDGERWYVLGGNTGRPERKQTGRRA
jgi:hypothetical protein